jgi:peroxiredoxin
MSQVPAPAIPAPPAVGSRAPGFSLTHRIGEPPVRLAELVRRGPVVVLFYPLAFSSVCTDEVCALQEAWAARADFPAQVVGISVDSPFVNARFAEATGATFPLLSDFNREASTAWGVRNDDFFGMRGVANRSAFVVNGEGVVTWAWVSEDAGVLPDLAAMEEAVQAARRPAA